MKSPVLSNPLLFNFLFKNTGIFINGHEGTTATEQIYQHFSPVRVLY